MVTFTVNKKYPYQVWLTSISIAPLFLLLFVAALGGQGINSGILFLYLYFVFFGAAFSLPTLFIFCLASKEFVYTSVSDNVKKLLLAFIAISAMSLTFYVIMGKDAFTTKDHFGITVPASYAVSIILSAFMHNLRKD